MGVLEERGPQLGILQAIRGSRGDLSLGPEGRPASHPLRCLDGIAAADADADPARSFRQAPWRLEVEQLVAHTPSSREFATAWLLLREAAGEGEGEPLSLLAFTDLVGDGHTPAQRAACWLWLQGPQTFFRWRHGQVWPLARREVQRLRRERWLRARTAQRQAHWSELLRRRQPLPPLPSLGPEAERDLAQLRRWAEGDGEAPLDESLRRTLQKARCAIESGAIRHLLVDLGQWSPHHLPSLARSAWQLGFSAEQLAEADRLEAEAEREQPGDPDRLDLTGLHTVTIDDDDTADIDDGLSLEWRGDRPRLWIHVADPGRLIPADSLLDREARRRGTSLYLARDALPMFPPQLATGPLSLRSGQRCAAWSLAVELDGEGAIADQSLHRSWVRPAYRLSYADADELLELAPPQERDLLMLHELLQRRRRWRVARGALLLDQPEGRVRCRGGRAELEIIEPGPARLLVAEAMILAGAAVAAHGQRSDLPLPFRSQLPSALPSAAELAALAPGPVRHAALKRCLSRGSLGTRAAPHFSLGLEAYVQATSPIRRYSDLLVQRQLAAQAAGQAPLVEAELAERLAEIEAPLREAIAISRDDQRHWQPVWFETHPQPEWPAVFLRWLRPQDQLALVWLEDLALELPARCPAGTDPGDALLLQVKVVDSLRDQLRLEARA
ncbi:MAG: ribonuclease catalytic domain-containing protein [Synechococcaceae cyanobacterium]